jgi:type IV pilus assembly protein PilO
MAMWSELPARTQWAVILGVAVAITVGAYFLMFKPAIDQNTTTGQQLMAVKAENDSLRPYRDKLTDLERQIESLKQQLEIQKRIVPDEKEADTFIRLVQATATAAGIEIRSYISKPTAAKEFFVEAPFDINIDGPYYSVLSFFDKMAKLDRIINVSGLQMASTEKPAPARVRKSYNYAPTETVVASCTATTYFSRDTASAAAPAPKK